MALGEDRRWLRSEDQFWNHFERKDNDRRGFFWVLLALAALLLVRLAGFPGRFYT